MYKIYVHMVYLDTLPRLRAAPSQLCTPRTRSQMTADCQFGDHDRVGIRLTGHVHWTKLVLRVEFLLKTDSGYPKDTGVDKPWQPLGIPFAITHIGQLQQSPPSPIPGDLERGPSHQSTCSNIETRMDRPKSAVRVIRGLGVA